MNRQLLNNGKYLLSFQREELRSVQGQELIKKLQALPQEFCKQSGNQYNYMISPDVISLTDDFEYGPFTKQEYLEGEIALIQFLAQFDDPNDIL